MPTGALGGRRALVTGGGRGIGRAVALALAREGAGVAVAARSSEPIHRVAREIGALGTATIGLTADVTSPEAVVEMADEASRRLGPIDILVNCAGGAESAPATRTDRALWARTLAVNLDSVFMVTSALLPGMIERGWGRVINIASRAGLEGFAYVSAYCAAKHGVIGFTRATALEVAGKGVTINALCPGYVDTDMTRRSAERIADKTGLSRDEALARLARFNPSGNLIQPETVAAAAVLLASPGGDVLNGQAVPL
jgi:3-hydroxybutyrate dehydrogenase